MADLIKEQMPTTPTSPELLQGQRQTLEELDQGTPKNPG